jgi:DUF2892 family protein
MRRHFTRSLGTSGRTVRRLIAAVLILAAMVAIRFSATLGLLLLVPGLFFLFEALRGWCALRACGIRTKI